MGTLVDVPITVPPNGTVSLVAVGSTSVVLKRIVGIVELFPSVTSWLVLRLPKPYRNSPVWRGEKTCVSVYPRLYWRLLLVPKLSPMMMRGEIFCWRLYW